MVIEIKSSVTLHLFHEDYQEGDPINISQKSDIAELLSQIESEGEDEVKDNKELIAGDNEIPTVLKLSLKDLKYHAIKNPDGVETTVAIVDGNFFMTNLTEEDFEKDILDQLVIYKEVNEEMSIEDLDWYTYLTSKHEI